jgi:hypothetical protein
MLSLATERKTKAKVPKKELTMAERAEETKK